MTIAIIEQLTICDKTYECEVVSETPLVLKMTYSLVIGVKGTDLRFRGRDYLVQHFKVEHHKDQPVVVTMLLVPSPTLASLTRDSGILKGEVERSATWNTMNKLWTDIGLNRSPGGIRLPDQPTAEEYEQMRQKFDDLAKLLFGTTSDTGPGGWTYS